MKKLTPLILGILLLSGCIAPSTMPSPSVGEISSQSTTFEENAPKRQDITWMENWQDFSGKQIEIDWNNIQSINLNYAIGWNFDDKEYREIRAGDRFEGYEVNSITSSYLVLNQNSLVCIQNEIILDGMRATHLQGVLMASKDGMSFHPYPSQTGDNLVYLTARTDELEKQYAEASQLTVSGSQTVVVQPVSIGFAYWVDEMLINEISKFTTGTGDSAFLETLIEPIYLDAEIKFSELHLFAQATNHGDDFYNTGGSGVILNRETEDIIIKSRL